MLPPHEWEVQIGNLYSVCQILQQRLSATLKKTIKTMIHFCSWKPFQLILIFASENVWRFWCFTAFVSHLDLRKNLFSIFYTSCLFLRVVFFLRFCKLSLIPSITRTNCALDRRTILCLCFSGFHRQTFKHVLKCKWIPLTKFPWIPSTNTCNVNFVGIFVVLRSPHQAKIASCSEFRKCKWNIQKLEADSANCKWIQNFVYYCTCIWTIKI